MPQMGQSPGASRTISGCIGQVNPPVAVDIPIAASTCYFTGSN